MSGKQALAAASSFLPYWWGDAGDPENGPSNTCAPLSSDHKTDMLVIGGGYTGMSVAREMKKRHPDMKITVCEAKFSGFGASGRNGGFLTPLVGHDNNHLIQALGERNAQKTCQWMRDAVNEVHDLIKNNNIECNYSNHGILYTSWTTPQVSRIESNQTASLKLGYKTKAMTTEQIREWVGGASPALQGGWYEKSNSGNFNPYKLARGLLEKTVLPLGVDFYENSPVANLKWVNDELITCEVNGHKVEAKNVVLCTNSYTYEGTDGKNGLKLYPDTFCPLHVYQVVTEVLSPEAREKLKWNPVGPDGKNKFPPAFYTFHRILFGVRLTHDGRIAMGTGLPRYYFGGKMHVGDSEDIYKVLEDKIYDFFPCLDESERLKIDYRWEGIIASTLDDMPKIGRDKEKKNLYYSFCYNGHGCSMANYSGTVVADFFDNYGSALEKYEGLPFVEQPRPPLLLRVPPDPIRYAAVNFLIWQKYFADRFEDKFDINGDLPFMGAAAFGVMATLLRLVRRFR